MWSWKAPLDALCALLPVVAFASPATVLLPVLRGGPGRGEPPRPRAVEMPPLALTSQMLQCFLFAVYARQMGMRTLLVPNAAGFSLGFAWSTIYPFKVVDDDGLRRQWRAQYSASLLLMLGGALTVRTAPHVSSTVAAAVGVLMCTYPLPSMRQAYAEGNSGLMGSPAMNLAMFACCSAWVVHSSPLVEYDIFVLVSNAAGVAVQGGALVLRVMVARKARIVRIQAENSELSCMTPLL